MTNSRRDATDESPQRSPRRVRNRVLTTALIVVIWQLILAPGVVWITGTTTGHSVQFSPWEMYELENSGLYSKPPYIGGVVWPAQLISLYVVVLVVMSVWHIVTVKRELDQLRVREQI